MLSFPTGHRARFNLAYNPRVEHGLLVDVAIILVAAFPVLFLGRILRLPAVTSFLITGILIGPHALQLIRDTDQIEAIAELGVALILFFIGLHLPLEKIRSLGKTTFISGSLQMLLTIGLTLIPTMLMGWSLRLSIFCGILIAMSSSAVVLPILGTRDETGAPYARKFLGVSIFQDLAVIPLMLLVPLFATAGARTPPAAEVMQRMALAAGGVLLFMFLGRLLAPALFSRIARLGSRESFTAAAIVLIIGTVALAHQVGVSAALGAFVAGVVIGDTEYIHEISGILRPFRDFLSSLFFASIGMLLDPRFLIRNWFMIISVILGIVALKVLAAYPSVLASDTTRRTAMRTAFALAPIGELSFLLAQSGKQFQILTPLTEQIFISSAVLTLATAPLLITLGNHLAERIHGGSRPSDDPAAGKPSDHIVIIGYGLNGQNVAKVLTATSIPHLIIEEEADRVSAARHAGSKAILADGSDPEALLAAGVDRARAIVVAISDPDGTRRIVHTCRRMNETARLIVRTRYVAEVERLRGLGADEVIPEEFETSLEIVTRVLRVFHVPGNLLAAQLRLLRDEGYRMLRDPDARQIEGRRLSAILSAGVSETFLVLPDTFAEGQSIEDLSLEELHVSVAVLLRDGKTIPPRHEEVLRAADTLVLVGAHDDLMHALSRLEGQEARTDRGSTLQT